jgi:hypothetical protein
MRLAWPGHLFVLLVGGLLACTGRNPAYLDKTPSSDGQAGGDVVVREGDTPAPVGCPSGAGTPVSTRLVGHWKFDENAGAVCAVDSSGHGHVGTLEGLAPSTAWAPGRKGNALRITALDGLDVGVRVKLTPLLAGLQRFTIAAWINRPTGDPSIGSVLSRQLGNSFGEIYNLSIGDADIIVWMGGVGLGTVELRAPAPAGVWTHIATTFDGSFVRVFKNGVEASRVALTRPLASDTTPLYLGTNKNDPANGPAHGVFVGLLDEVVLYQVALSATAIQSLYLGTAPDTL